MPSRQVGTGRDYPPIEGENMLRSILSKAVSGRGRRTTPTTGRKTTPGATGGSANSEIARGATSVAKGLGRKRKGR